MPQSLFNLNVVVTALRCRASGCSTEEMAGSLAQGFKNAYADRNLAEDISEAASATIKMVDALMPAGCEAQVIPTLFKLEYWVEKYEPDGKRKPWKLFNGTRFNFSAVELDQKKVKCQADMCCYLLKETSRTEPLMSDSEWDRRLKRLTG